jgi:hypothetical protein
MATGTHFREIITIISRPRERFRALSFWTTEWSSTLREANCRSEISQRMHG